MRCGPMFTYLRAPVVPTAGFERGYERRVVVLANGEDVEADLLRLGGESHHRLDSFCLGGRTTSVGSGVTSPTVKTANCTPAPPLGAQLQLQLPARHA
jgi:hypothetical protein